MPFDFAEDIVLENPRVRIAPLTEADTQHLLKVASEDKDLVQYSPYSIYQPDELHRYVVQALSDRKQNIRYVFSIFDKQLNEWAGSTAFGNISNHDERIEIGWTWLGRHFKGTGLNAHCKFLLLQYIFETLGFQRTEFKTDERNIQSRKALEKIGAKMEGILRSHTVMLDGFRRNTVYYSILKTEWPQVRDKLEIISEV
jgi:RimJ/RimL family protein N-acetyltransferase